MYVCSFFHGILEDDLKLYGRASLADVLKSNAFVDGKQRTADVYVSGGLITEE